jgi:hypothetical protein
MRLTVLLLGALLIGACASGPSRSLESFRATAYGGMLPPPGSGLVQETFTPAHSSFESETTPVWTRACLVRIFATNDADAFASRVNDLSTVNGARVRVSRSGIATKIEADATTIRVSILDLDTEGLRGLFTNLIDRRAWRWMVTVRIADAVRFDDEGEGAPLAC